jgi:hypothetical protein
VTTNDDAKRPRFKRRTAPVAGAADPEALFGELPRTPSGVGALWSHQADQLRTYAKDHRDTPDVALELPTGSGKTLVGLLIADWRRQTLGQRVVYACPTKQLARQVLEKANAQGIPAVLLIGSHWDWDQAQLARYTRGDAVAVTMLITAIGLTGSNGAFVGVAIALVVGATLQMFKARGPIFAIAVVGLGLALGGVAAPHIDVAAIQQQAADSIQPLHDSLGRSDTSGQERQVLFSEGMRLFRAGDLIGIGPGRTKDTLASQGAAYVKEAHDDYVATLVERGALGGVGLIIVISAAGVRLTRVTFRPLPSGVAALVPRPEYLLGLGFALLAQAFFYEIFHFRQLWAFLGLVAGLEMVVHRQWPR